MELNNNKGFTLVETLVYVAIIGFVVSTFVAFGISITNSRNKSFSTQEVNANARIALDYITKYIRESSGVNTSTSVFGTDPGVLSLSMSSSTLNPTILSLDQDDGVLQVTQGTGSPMNLTTDQVKVSQLIFTNFTSSTRRENIGIELNVEYSSDPDATFSYSNSFKTSATVRK